MELERAADLTGDRLNYWFARALGMEPHSAKAGMSSFPDWQKSWGVMGPHIERYKISIDYHEPEPRASMFEVIEWNDFECGDQRHIKPVAGASGPTALIAAMRCLIAARIGKELTDA